LEITLSHFAAPTWVWAGRAGSFLTIAAALVLAVDHAPPMRWLFIVWTISNALWFWYGWKIGSGSLVSAQIVFLIIDVVGITHYWILGNTIWLNLFG
jgi:hypothetical protein